MELLNKKMFFMWKRLKLCSYLGITILLAYLLVLKIKRRPPQTITYSHQRTEDDFFLDVERITNKKTKEINASFSASDIKSIINQYSKTNFEDINADVIMAARKISAYSKTVLVTMVNDKYLELAYSWLCNTKHFNIHRRLLMMTTDKESYNRLKNDWPEVVSVCVDIPGLKGDQFYSQVGYIKVMVKRTVILMSLVMADIEFFMVEMDCVWFENALNKVVLPDNVDMLVNPVVKDIYNGGLMYVVPTERSKQFWAKLAERMVLLESENSYKKNSEKISENENDQVYMSQLVIKRLAKLNSRQINKSTHFLKCFLVK